MADLVMTARRADRLEALAHELETAHRIKAYAVPADLSRPGAPTELVQEIQARGLAVHWLVNNAGFGTGGGASTSSRWKARCMRSGSTSPHRWS